MYFRISAPNLTGGMRLIDEIPDYRICHLEGRNGIGKTAAIRLLELITGEQPYRSLPAAWESLRQSLGDAVVVTVGGSADGELIVRLTPDLWPSAPEPPADWLGDATQGGRPVNVTNIPRLLRVIRIAGDETFEVTIRRRVMAESAAFERAHSHFEARRVQVDEVLEELTQMVGAVDAERLARDRKQLMELAAQIRRTEMNLRAQQREIDLLRHAMIANRRVGAHTVDVPAVEAELVKVTSKASDLEKRLREAEQHQAQLVAELARGSQLEKQVSDTRRSRDARRKRYEAIERQVQQRAARLGVTAGIEVVTRAEADTIAERRKVEQELASAGHIGAVRNFADRVVQDLNMNSELEPEVLAILDRPTHERLTGSDLRRALHLRRMELEDVDDDPVVRALEQRSRDLRARLEELGILRKGLEALGRAADRLAADESQLAALVRRAEATTGRRAEYEQLAASIQGLRTDLRSTLAEEARLKVRLFELTGDKQMAEVTEELQLALAALELKDATGLENRLQQAARNAELLRATLTRQRNDQLELDRSAALLSGEIQRIRRRLSGLDWLPPRIRLALATSSPSSNSLGSEPLVHLHTAINSVRESLYGVRARFDEFVEAGRTLATAVGQGDRFRPDTRLVNELAAELGSRLRTELDQDEIRQALFDGGELASIDLVGLEAKWKVDGEERSRPFEAFSSGEQVFAYTRARIERVEEITATHKVIALDEFGAFLARDRLERLARYLRDAVVGRIANQVLIVVPLAANYKTQAKETRGELQKRFEHRSKEIERRGYFADDAAEQELV